VGCNGFLRPATRSLLLFADFFVLSIIFTVAARRRRLLLLVQGVN
jgi:hypothetical protein